MNNDVSFSYVPESALDNGQLLEVETDFSQQAGFTWPVRITKGVYDLVNLSKEAQEHCQDFESRLWNVLCQAHSAITEIPLNQWLVYFSVSFDNGPDNHQPAALYAALDETRGLAVHIMLIAEHKGSPHNKGELL